MLRLAHTLRPWNTTDSACMSQASNLLPQCIHNCVPHAHGNEPTYLEWSQLLRHVFRGKENVEVSVHHQHKPIDILHNKVRTHTACMRQQSLHMYVCMYVLMYVSRLTTYIHALQHWGHCQRSNLLGCQRKRMTWKMFFSSPLQEGNTSNPRLARTAPQA